MRKTLLIVCTVTTMSLFAQLDSLITVKGSFDVYFRQNINSTSDPGNGGTVAPPTAFANLPGFAVGMANVKTSYNKKNVGLVADFVLGPRGRDAVFNSPSPLNLINQLYMTYSLNSKLAMTIGKFNTYIGYEVICPVGNTHYSTSYLFSYGPFNHTGLKINYDLGNGFSTMAAVMNPTDYTDFNPSNTYYGGWQLAYSKSSSTASINMLATKDFYQLDITASQKLGQKYTIGLNASTASKTFDGLALYQVYSATDHLDLACRLEHFRDKGLHALQGSHASVTDITFSLGLKTENFRLIPEWRIDLFNSDENIEPIITDASTSASSDRLSSIVIAAIANF